MGGNMRQEGGTAKARNNGRGDLKEKALYGFGDICTFWVVLMHS